ncbi:unnamed protein product [Diatraea saccharalis]|uniref:NFX1-type zinc finger-containing protein 1 n=1 Tax=Diatraea saccharalis TaxID=40085 RepID=A0A9N9QZ82_9NEOP|nr:unnamed protein product [Diatraea saccharalis]
MTDRNKPSLRIDWFDGTLIEDNNPNIASISEFDNEEEDGQQSERKPNYVERKPIGFKRLLDISSLEGPILILEVSHRPGFWMLLDSQLKGDFIVIIVKVLANIYNSVQPGEKSRITNLLKTQFERSNFLNTMKEFLINLPSVRVVEKKMNSKLWDDAEAFFSNVVYLCEGIVNYDTNNIELLIKICELLDVTETSAIGVKEEHTETFNDKLFIRIHNLHNKINNIICNNDMKSVPQSSNILNEDSRSFRKLSIYPSRDDLLGNIELLIQPNIIVVSFQNPVSKNVFSKPYLMVESEVFFEPYHRVLRVLQSFKDNDMPMQKYIVNVQNETQPPSYLQKDTVYSIIENNTLKELSFDVLSSDNWPQSISFGLDDSQMEAYKLALTREFAVIQGPPGTGKTFIGVKIASTLLRNLSLQGTPMLIICYTNHALDKFLEGILNVTTNIVRLGSQSKSKTLESYTLNNLRYQVKSKFSHLYAKKRSELEKIYKEMTDLQTEIEKCEKEILCYETIKPYLKINDKLYELKNYDEDPILSWLFNDVKESKEAAVDNLDDWDKQFDDISMNDIKIETCFSEEWALKEIDSMMNSIQYVKDITDDHSEAQKITDQFEMKINGFRKRINCFKKYISLGQNEVPVIIPGEAADLYSLTLEQRWALYYQCVGTIKKELMTKMNNLLVWWTDNLVKVAGNRWMRGRRTDHVGDHWGRPMPSSERLSEQHNVCNKELDEISTLIDCDVMRNVRVVGVTTTTAARRHDLMRQLLSPIVIVEEAAEVLEAHIVASLTRHCQHLILIGDHKQLKPNAAQYKLAKHYNLEISLFERMIRNGVHAKTLTTQRRMRPDFVDLLVPTIYEKLDCHPNVYEYPDVRGMQDNLYFYTHDVFEDSEGLEDSWSHKNSVEAKWCVALADYLRQMKYNSDEITILSTYTGQVALIKEFSKKYPKLRDVKMTAVDSYQGKENRIIILSLVRSNKDISIGFLSAANRICVALSRAKEGFYIFGNMNVLKSASNIWKLINDKLVAKNAIGNIITLRCDTHKFNTLKTQNHYCRCWNQCFSTVTSKHITIGRVYSSDGLWSSAGR